MLTLAIETSLIPGSIAINRDGETLEERTLPADRRHAESLVLEIQQLFSAHGAKLRDCELIAVSVGPGSFTGLRVGVTVAKTLAYATGAAVAAVGTLTAVAHNVNEDCAKLFVISDAQRKQFFCGEFARRDDGAWREVCPVKIVGGAEWAAQRSAEDVITGPALAKSAEIFPAECRLLPQDLWLPRAMAVAELGLTRQEQGEITEPVQLKPVYLRQSAAEERLIERKNGR